MNFLEFFFYIGYSHGQLFGILVWLFVLIAQSIALGFGFQFFRKMKQNRVKELPTRSKFLPRNFFVLASSKFHIGVRIRGAISGLFLIFCLFIWQFEGLVLLGNEYQDNINVGYTPEYLLYLVVMTLTLAFK